MAAPDWGNWNRYESFPTIKHFVSWCGLSPGRNQSGKKSKWIKQAPCNKAGQIFLEAAQSLGRVNTPPLVVSFEN
ncbi:MAG: transposase [Chitinophagaceae bacterium]|nr:transposase [Chitinophagaceae bacterium]